MKNLLFIIILCFSLFFIGIWLSNEPKQDTEQIIQLNEELTTQGEIIVSKGKLSHSDIIILDNWMPFNKTELDYTFIYEYHISYQLSKTNVKIYGDSYLITLQEDFTYNIPTLIEERFSVSKQIFGKKINSKTYVEIIDNSREIVYNKITEFDIKGYKLSVEKNIINIAKKFNITNIKFIWE